jgi:hypothetical protein
MASVAPLVPEEAAALADQTARLLRLNGRGQQDRREQHRDSGDHRTTS